MEKKLRCIMLVDDNADDNFFHKRVILKSEVADSIVIKKSGEEALDYLKSIQRDHSGNYPDLIFLDINMPRMNGWEFIEEYKKLDEEFKCKVVIIMLTTSDSPDDKALASKEEILSDIRTKPLTKEMLDEIIARYCSLPGME
jgi:CheY-like chemotaxis protein